MEREKEMNGRSRKKWKRQKLRHYFLLSLPLIFFTILPPSPSFLFSLSQNIFFSVSTSSYNAGQLVSCLCGFLTICTGVFLLQFSREPEILPVPAERTHSPPADVMEMTVRKEGWGECACACVCEREREREREKKGRGRWEEEMKT